jgi:thioredoxin-dependent peroxiredoxin
MITIGVKAPDFRLPDQNGREIHLETFKGKWVVLYFYPKDNTPGCTAEACDFTGELAGFENLGAVVLGASPDSAKSHRGFIEKQNLKITLLSDPDHSVMESYGAWQEKSMYGKKYMGVQRSTFLIDPQGKLAHFWPKVKVKGHVAEVRSKLEELQGS